MYDYIDESRLPHPPQPNDYLDANPWLTPTPVPDDSLAGLRQNATPPPEVVAEWERQWQLSRPSSPASEPEEEPAPVTDNHVYPLSFSHHRGFPLGVAEAAGIEDEAIRSGRLPESQRIFPKPATSEPAAAAQDGGPLSDPARVTRAEQDFEAELKEMGEQPPAHFTPLVCAPPEEFQIRAGSLIDEGAFRGVMDGETGLPDVLDATKQEIYMGQYYFIQPGLVRAMGFRDRNGKGDTWRRVARDAAHAKSFLDHMRLTQGIMLYNHIVAEDDLTDEERQTGITPKA